MPIIQSNCGKKTETAARTIRTLGDFLDDLQKTERRLDRRHAAIRNSTADNNVKLLTYFLRLHARRVGQCMNEILRWDPKALRAAALPPSFCFTPRGASDLLRVKPAEVTGQQLLQTTIRYHSDILDVIIEIRLRSTRGKVRCLLTDIIQLERRTVRLLQRMISTHYF